MSITNELIIECAKYKGFKLPNTTFNYFGKLISVTDKDISVSRAKTAPFAGSKDLGEWWVSYTGSISVTIVTDGDMKEFLRDNKLKQIGI